MVFLFHEVALLCSDDAIIQEDALYEILVHLANYMYLLHHGRLNEAKLDEAQEEIDAFAVKSKSLMKEEAGTQKWHHAQHLVQLARRHGPAFLWDGFIGNTNYEHHFAS